MSFVAEAIRTLKEVVLVNERIERMAHAVERLDQSQRASHERLVRAEVFIDMLREACIHRTFPHR